MYSSRPKDHKSIIFKLLCSYLFRQSYKSILDFRIVYHILPPCFDICDLSILNKWRSLSVFKLLYFIILSIEDSLNSAQLILWKELQ